MLDVHNFASGSDMFSGIDPNKPNTYFVTLQGLAPLRELKRLFWFHQGLVERQ